MRLSLFLTAFILTACTSVPKAPDKAYVLTPVPCVKVSDLPAMPVVPPKPDDFQKKQAAMLGYVIDLETAVTKLRNKLEACATP